MNKDCKVLSEGKWLAYLTHIHGYSSVQQLSVYVWQLFLMLLLQQNLDGLSDKQYLL